MDKQHLSASLKINGKRVNLSLGVYLFPEDDVQIAYCPALNLCAYGNTTDEAKEEFEFILQEHLEWCVEHNTLEADLIQHGWRMGQKSYTAPLVTDMLMSNDTLREIVNHKDYQRIIIAPPKFHRKRAYA